MADELIQQQPDDEVGGCSVRNDDGQEPEQLGLDSCGD